MKKILDTVHTFHRVIEYEPINEFFCKYKDTVTESSEGIKLEEKVSSGVATIDEIKSIKDLQSITHKVNVDWMYEGYGRVITISEDDYNKLMNCEIHISELNIWDKDESEGSISLILNRGSNQLADLNKEIIPFPVYFDYIDCRVNEATYDLDAVLKYMKSDKRFIPAKFIKSFKYNTDELHLIEIPYYNRDEETGKYAIEFCYLPESKDEAMKLSKSCLCEKSDFAEFLLSQFKRK